MEMCEGFMGVRSIGQLLRHLENKFLRDTGGAQFDAIFVDQNWERKSEIPDYFHPVITFVDAGFIQEKLETNEYFPVLLTSKKACVNSALFCQKTALYLEEKFKHRFTLYEHSPVSEIRLSPEIQNEVWI